MQPHRIYRVPLLSIFQSLFLLLVRASVALAAPFISRSSFAINANVLNTFNHQERPEWGSPEFYEKLIISIVLVLLGGVFAGYVV